MEIVGSIGLGIGLSAACGFRIFLPLLITSILGMAGWIPLTSEGTRWIATEPAALAFGSATLIEILGYFVPWLDNFLDSIATPAAIVAGVLVSVSTMVDLPPLVRWTVAIIAGGGVAGAVQGLTVLARAKSTTFTGGVANHVVAVGELAGSLLTTLAAILFPVVALVLILIAVFVLYRVRRLFKVRKQRANPSDYHQQP
ncbi:MAG: putative rane protein [Bacteroidetes bacterium]|jgi:hypothetical protein|nr:putative rane protein [Bacteroidota bacterium]